MVGDEKTEGEAPLICYQLDLLAPAYLTVKMLREVLVDIQHPGFVQGVEWVGGSEMLCNMLADI